MATRYSRNHKRNRKQSPLKVFHGRAWAWLSFVERNCKILERQPHNQNFIMPRGHAGGARGAGGGGVGAASCVFVCVTLQLTFHLGQQQLPRIASRLSGASNVKCLTSCGGDGCRPRSATSVCLDWRCLCSSWMDSHNDLDQQIQKKKKPPPNKLQQLQATSSTSSLVLALTRSLSLSVSVSLSCALSPAAQNRQCYVSRRPWGPKLLVLRQPTVSLGAHAHARSPIQRKSNRIQIETESLSGYSTVPTFDLLQHQDLSFSVAITHTILNTIRYAYDTHTICNIPWIVWKMRWKETQRNFISVFFGYLCGSVRFA